MTKISTLSDILLLFRIISVIFLLFSSAEGKHYGDDKLILIKGHPIFNDDINESDKNEIYGIDKKIQEDGMITHSGTNWCGRSDTSRDYHDLGKYQETDTCCRDHYHCDNIPGGGEKYGLINKYKSTRSNCRCDRDFFNCLHKINDTVSNTVGNEYFSFAKSCFQEDYPIVDCLQNKSVIFEHRCIKYTYDTSKPKIYQWFDLPYYNSDAIPEVSTTDYDEFYRIFNSHLSPSEEIDEAFRKNMKLKYKAVYS